MKYHIIPVRIAIKMYRNSKCWLPCLEKGTQVHCWGLQIGAATVDDSMKMHQKIKIELPCEQ